jgi:adenylate cyclase
MFRRPNRRILIYAAIVAAATGVGWLGARSSLGEQLELRTYDYRFRVKGIFPDPSSPPITILAIDENSLQHIPDPLMLWHRHYADVLNHLTAADPAVVCVDVIFSDIRRFDPDGERAFSQALVQSETPLVLAYRVRAEGVEQPPPAVMMAESAGHIFGFANFTIDSDDFIRRQTLQQRGNDATLRPGLALAVARAYATRMQAPLTISTEPDTILINYKPRGTFPRVSFYDALEAARKNDTAFFQERFRGRIVFIARTSTRGGDDLHSTPLYYSPDDGAEGLRTTGAEIHVNTIATLLESRPVRELRTVYQVSLIAVMVLVMTIVWARLRVFPALMATILLLVLFMAFALSAFVQNVWVWTVAPVSGAGAALVFTLAANYLSEGREKRRIRSLFSRYVSDAVIAQLLERPEGVALHGERRKVAVLFADIRGFTTISETMAAEKVVYLLNEYFATIVEAIQSRRGTVNCLMGDGIMSIFGAPIPDDDAALHAVEAALEMMRRLRNVNEHLKRQGFNTIEIGIGINAGEAVIGNIGSPRKMEYTATGDVVNTAARIEGRTRTIPGAEILISHDVYVWLAGRIPADYVGEEELKGKQRPVALYRVPWEP